MLYTLVLGSLLIFHSFASELKLRIPWPSGIPVDTVQGNDGHEYRFGRLLQNAISLRIPWRKVGVLENVFSNAECLNLISKAEAHAQKFGWSKGRHIDYDLRPTKDLPVPIIFEYEEDWNQLMDKLSSRILPHIADEYGLNVSLLKPSDLFITKYDGTTKENFLGPHKVIFFSFQFLLLYLISNLLNLRVYMLV
jgi:hypothetical protein